MPAGGAELRLCVVSPRPLGISRVQPPLHRPCSACQLALGLALPGESLVPRLEGLVPLRRHLPDPPVKLVGGVDGELPGDLCALGGVGHLLPQALVRGLQGLELVTERAELLLVLGDVVVLAGHPRPPVLLEVGALAVELSP